jgi:uncharacterized protein YqeY
MSLETKVMEALKEAMKAKDQTAMLALRDIKSAILLFKTDGSNKELNNEEETKIIQKLIKKRKDASEIFSKQNRQDLFEKEEGEIKILEQFLPAQMSVDEIQKVVQQIIHELQATSVKDMGKVMGAASKALAGKADNKIISEFIKKILNT